MKKLIKNKRGFTLIELLAVIVILAILVMVAIPMVTRYLNAARQGTYVDNAKSAISAVRNDVIIGGANKTTYTLNDINKLLEKKLITSPFGSKYCTESQVTIEYGSDGSATYSIVLRDKSGRGITSATKENELADGDVKIVQDSSGTCTEVSG